MARPVGTIPSISQGYSAPEATFWGRLKAALAAWRRAWRAARAERALAGLPAHLLRDIGAGPALIARAEDARRSPARFPEDAFRS